jgi:hypothetical protein
MSIEQSATVPPPARTRRGRLATYLAEMFPPQVMGTFAAFHFLAVWFALQALQSAAPVRLTWASIRGIATVALFLLLMRLYDELKDAEADIRLGRAGDPWYRDRALVTGAVRLDDVKWLRWVVTALLVAINVAGGAGYAAAGFWAAFLVAWLSFQWFFWPRMSEYLLVAFVTHNPISLLVSGYIVGLFADTFAVESLSRGVIPLLLGLWFPIAAWETSRKVRAPGDETSYRTYSRVLGWKVAPLLPAAFVVASAAMLVNVSRAAGLHVAFPVVIVAAALAVVWRCALFRIAPTAEHAQLKPWAILYATTANAGLAIAAAARSGVTW